MTHIKRTVSGTIADVLIIVITGLFTLVCIYPFWYMLMYSLSEPSQITQGLYLIPKNFSLYNITKVLELNGIWLSLVVSITRTVSGTILTVLCCSFMGYLFTKQDMPFRTLIYRTVIITMYVSGGLIPTYLVMRAYQLYNTYWIYIIPGAVAAWNVVMIKTFIESLPQSLEESAVIDGAGYVRVYMSIIMPLSKPIIATIAVFAAVGHWNTWFDSHIYITDSKLYTLQYLLYRMLNETQRIAEMLKQNGNIADAKASMQQTLTPRGVRSTVTLIATLPIFLIYPFAQRYFVKGIMIGAIKG